MRGRKMTPEEFRAKYPKTDTWITNKLGHHLYLNCFYRFVWQKTAAKWRLQKVENGKAFMRSKNGNEFVGKVDDIVRCGLENLPNYAGRSKHHLKR